MFTRALGKSGIRVSAVGLGTARIGGMSWRLDDLTVPGAGFGHQFFRHGRRLWLRL
jgi:aryl-alcohol dehydrogenase-like predicted oxidoreductase